MARVSENSNTAALQYAIGKAKQKLENLQIKGSTLKRMTEPSDDPVGNVELLAIRSRSVDNDQFKRNSTYAKSHLEYTDSSLADLVEVVNKAKEIAISQSSDLYNDHVRKSVAKEVEQLRKGAISIANRRLGNRYIFSGFSTLTRPFDTEGKYQGDDGRIYLEIAKDFFVPVNLHGLEVFYNDEEANISGHGPLKDFAPAENAEDTDTKPGSTTPPLAKPENPESPDSSEKRTIASENEKKVDGNEAKSQNLFDLLKTLENALNLADTDLIQDLLPKLDQSLDHLITARAHVGALSNSLHHSELTLDKNEVINAEHKTRLEDADVAELFTNIKKQQDILKATYQVGSKLLNQNLLDFLR